MSRVIIDKSYVSIELNKYLNKSSNYNMGLVTKIVYGVLENDISLEYFIKQQVARLPEIKILILLKMVAYVGHNINSIPPFALVNEVVSIAKTIDFHKSGFVNVVSKKLITNSIKYPSKSNKVKYLSVRYNYPEWVIVELLKEHDEEFVTRLVSCELSSLTHIRVNTSKITVEDFKKKLAEYEIFFENSYYDYTMYIDYATLLTHNELKEYYVVQGLPSIITCNVLGAKEGRVLDVCSAPGGKSVFLAHNKNLKVYACDLHAHRVELIKKYADSVGVKVLTCVQDSTKTVDKWKEKFDYVMCDVPCSNIGVSRKKPDVFLNKTENNMNTLAQLQYKILSTASQYVKSGGILQYSTCTILSKENKCVVEKFLKEHDDFELTQIDFGDLNIYNDNNLYTFYPHMTGTEGFFIGRLKRK